VRPIGLLACAVLLSLLAGCGCAECDEERIPHRGHAATPEDLVQVVQHEAHYDCASEMYDLLSAKTREKYSRLEWRLGVSSIRVPDYDYKVVDVAEKGTFVAFLPNPLDANEGFAYYDYQEPGKKKMKLKLLLLLQGTPAEWKIAMLDQNDRIAAGDSRYWWFD
jgi:hypothetical protein